ncbi:MAG: type I methionyl aminopeptidase [Dehalococcoidia bacterium]
MAIELKSESEIAIMREAGVILADVLDIVMAAVQPGVRETELDDLVREEFKRRDVIPTFLGYNGYPATICVSVNDKIVHAIPNRRSFREGDVASIDLGLTHRGFVADCARTVAVGEVPSRVGLLIRTTEEALDIGIRELLPANHMGDVGAAIQEYSEARGFGVVREYVGHGVGRLMHEEPQVPNYGKRGKGLTLRKGMVLALEPMLNMGTWKTARDPDGWTVRTADGALSAHFEHTVAVTENGPLVLTTNLAQPAAARPANTLVAG